MLKGLLGGSFDPPTKGHVEFIHRAHKLVDQLIVAIAENNSKGKSLLSMEEKVNVLEKETKGLKNIRIEAFPGLLAEYAKKNGVGVLIRGLRSQNEFEYELQMATVNRNLIGIDTWFLMADPSLACISSTMVKELASYGASLKDFVPQEVERILSKRMQKGV